MKRFTRLQIAFLLSMVSWNFAPASSLEGVRIVGWQVFSDNINFDGRINPGENVRYGIIVENGTSIARQIYVIPSNDSVNQWYQFFLVQPGGRDSMTYNAVEPLSYFHFDMPTRASELVIRFSIFTYPSGDWVDSVVFPVIQFPFPIQKSVVSRVAGISEWEFDILLVNPSATLNHNYEISVDSIAPISTKGITLRDLTTGTTLFSRIPISDRYLHNVPITHGFKISGGRNFAIFGMHQDSTRWISSFPRWVDGDGRFYFYPYSALNGGVIFGGQFETPFMERNPWSSFDLSHGYPVEVRFDSTRPQKAYRLRRLGSYLIQDFARVPFSVWDTRNGRQLTLAWRDQNNSGTWDPFVGNSNVEIVFIYDKPYDSTGTTQFAMPPNAVPNEATTGPKANFVYLMSLGVMQGHVVNENPGTLYLRPVYALNEDDRFTFNPTIVLSLPEILPGAFALYQNYPNPFNPTTIIKYQLATQSRVTIRIFNLLGQEVKTLVDGVENSGVHQLQWDGRNSVGVSVASGVYFYRIEANAVSNRSNAFTQVKKMLLLR